MIRKLLLTLIAPALLAACGTPGVAGSAPSTSPTATVSATASATPTPTPTAIPTPTPAPPRVTPTVFVANNMALGTVLVNAQGRTLYYFVPERGGRIVCTGQCTNAWPPLLQPACPPRLAPRSRASLASSPEGAVSRSPTTTGPCTRLPAMAGLTRRTDRAYLVSAESGS